jgi:hypothetical protein
MGVDHTVESRPVLESRLPKTIDDDPERYQSCRRWGCAPTRRKAKEPALHQGAGRAKGADHVNRGLNAAVVTRSRRGYFGFHSRARSNQRRVFNHI